MNFCLGSSWQRFARAAGNHAPDLFVPRVEICARLGISGQRFARAYVDPAPRVGVHHGISVRDEQVYAQNYLGKTSFYGWFILWLWPPMNTSMVDTTKQGSDESHRKYQKARSFRGQRGGLEEVSSLVPFVGGCGRGALGRGFSFVS